jgi:hypothetical protein
MKRYIAVHSLDTGWATKEEVEAWILQKAEPARWRVCTMQDVTDSDLKESQAFLKLLREEKEKSYVEGLEMARKLLRIQLGLAVPSDRS